MNHGFQVLRCVAFALLLWSAALSLLSDPAGATAAATLVVRTLASVGGAVMFAAIAYGPLEMIVLALCRAAVHRRAGFADTHVAMQSSARRAASVGSVDD